MKKYLIYLAAALAADVLLVIIFFHYIHVSLASTIPSIFILGTIVKTPFIAFSQSRAGHSMAQMDNFRYRKSANGTSSFEIDEEEERRDKNHRAGNLFEYKFFVVFLPIYVLFVLFFNNAIKIASVLLLPAAIIVVGFIDEYRKRKTAAKLRAIREKERQEQEMREETGYWRHK